VAWTSAATAEAAAKALGLTERQASDKARRLRAAGLALKYMPGRWHWPGPGPKTRAVWELLRGGVPAAEIVRRGVASKYLVYTAARRLRHGR
jgi:hypothetical protein